MKQMEDIILDPGDGDEPSSSAGDSYSTPRQTRGKIMTNLQRSDSSSCPPSLRSVSSSGGMSSARSMPLSPMSFPSSSDGDDDDDEGEASQSAHESDHATVALHSLYGSSNKPTLLPPPTIIDLDPRIRRTRSEKEVTSHDRSGGTMLRRTASVLLLLVIVVCLCGGVARWHGGHDRHGLPLLARWRMGGGGRSREGQGHDRQHGNSTGVNSTHHRVASHHGNRTHDRSDAAYNHANLEGNSSDASHSHHHDHHDNGPRSDTKRHSEPNHHSAAANNPNDQSNVTDPTIANLNRNTSDDDPPTRTSLRDTSSSSSSSSSAVHDEYDATITSPATAAPPTPHMQLLELQHNLLTLDSLLSNTDNTRLKIESLAELLRDHRSHKRNGRHAKALEVERKLRGAAKFEVGRVVEQLYNGNTMMNRVLYPFRIVDLHFGDWEEEGEESIDGSGSGGGGGGDGIVSGRNKKSEAVGGSTRKPPSSFPSKLNHYERDGDYEEHDGRPREEYSKEYQEDDSSDHDDGSSEDDEEYDSSDDDSDDDNDNDDEQDHSHYTGIRYTIVRLLDGFTIHQIPESFLRLYVPYEPTTDSICNLGGAGMGQQNMVPCSIIEYVKPQLSGTAHRKMSGDENVRVKQEEEVEKAEYRVRMKRVGEDGVAREVEELVALGKVQRNNPSDGFDDED